MSTLRVGLLGCGTIARRHAGSMAMLPGEMKLVAACARDEARVAAFASEFGAAPFTDFDRMLGAAALDLLIVTLPPFAHSGQIEAAAAAGVHILAEKPLALDMARADAMVAAARDAGVVAACGLMYRFGAAVTRWNEAVASGETGRVGLFVGQYHCNTLYADWWRDRAKSGGQMVEQLIHIIDLTRHHLGEPQTVYARASSFFHRDAPGYDIDDVSAIVLGYANGSVAVLNGTNGAIPGRWEKEWQIVAEQMTGRFTGWNNAVLTHTGDVPRVETIDSANDAFVAQLADVAGAIRDKRPPRVSLADGAKTLRLALAARQSADEGREIAL